VALSLRPDSATVLAAMRRALVVDPERGPFGGVPRVLVPDGGLEFATTALARVCATLGTTVAPTDAYAPFQKPRVAYCTSSERFVAMWCSCRSDGVVPASLVAGWRVGSGRVVEDLAFVVIPLPGDNSGGYQILGCATILWVSKIV